MSAQAQEVIVKESTFEMLLRSAIELPGIKINRATFLQKELSKYFNADVVDKAIITNPAQAGVSVDELSKIAKACINYETTKVTTISAVAGIPGGIAMAATIPADVIQFFGHIIRILQKLVYLYGWQEMFRNNDRLDDETTNVLTLFVGVMCGVNAANVTIAKIAKAAALNIEKELVRKALTKGTIYPIVKKVAGLIGVEMTKNIFAKGVGKLIPVVGAVVSGGITFVSFKPMAKRLQKYLVTLPMASADFYKDNHADDIIEVDFSDVTINDTDESAGVLGDV